MRCGRCHHAGRPTTGFMLQSGGAISKDWSGSQPCVSEPSVLGFTVSVLGSRGLGLGFRGLGFMV